MQELERCAKNVTFKGLKLHFSAPRWTSRTHSTLNEFDEYLRQPIRTGWRLLFTSVGIDFMDRSTRKSS
jgi:hypothetical protein